MKLMLFLDFDNFCKSISCINSDLKERVNNFPIFISNYIKIKYSNYIDFSNIDIIRTYIYTGEVTDNLLNKIKKTDPIKFNKYEKTRIFQKKFFDAAIKFDCFEIRTKPLKYDGKEVFQKGVDVQLAVDMVTNAYNHNYDIAILCSGDLDLLDSLKVIKSFGKRVIICSHKDLCAKDMQKEADFFIDFSQMLQEDLDKFTFRKQNNH